MFRHTTSRLAAEAPSEVQHLRERAEAILWVQSQMARHNISIEALLSAGCFDAPKQRLESKSTQSVRYRDADEHTWDGHDSMPEWLQRAVNAGQSAEHVLVA